MQPPRRSPSRSQFQPPDPRQQDPETDLTLPPPPRRSRRRSVSHQQRSSQVNSRHLTQNSTRSKPGKRKRRIPNLLTQWWFWMVLGCTTMGGVITTSTIVLLQVPALPTCPEVFWPLASGSVRLYCAELSAKRRTPEDLLDAIKLLDGLDDDDGLRPLANEYLTKWTEELLDLTEAVVNAGDLNRAIAIVNRIPDDSATRELLAEKVKEWRSLWAEAEKLQNDVLSAMEQKRWAEAQILLRRLRSVDSPYWSNEKHGELNLRFKALIRDNGKINQARKLAKGRSQSGYQKALELLASIELNSPLYDEAQEAQVEISDQLLAKARQELSGGNGTGALAIANLLPENSSYTAERFDLQTLARAMATADRGTPADLELAIAEASRVTRDRPLYDRAQRMIAQWQRDTEFVGYLDRAKRIAARGTAADYTDAISQARRVPKSSAQYNEAQRLVASWSEEWQRQRDQPRLERARKTAQGGSINQLQAAIAAASKIPKDSPLASEVTADIRQWRSQLERRQDQPILNRAQGYASGQNWSQAVQVAQSLANSDRALSNRAQRLVTQWQREQSAQRNWQVAQQTAATNTIDGLTQALAIAQRVNNGTAVYSQVRQAMDRWSRQVVTLARQRGAFDSAEAIAWLQKVPQGTSGYALAQQQIQQWRSQSQPAPQPDPAIDQPFILETPPPSDANQEVNL